MSIFSAIGSALSGLTAQAANLSTISNNISNASTVGYKQAETEFDSMVEGGADAAALGGVATTTRMDISTAGQLQSTGVGTDIAISGQGFMVVNTNATSSSGSYLLTRAGSFRPDASGNLVNAAGYYLQGEQLNLAGTPINPASALGSLTTVNVSNLSDTGSETTSMTFTANLPSSDTAYAATAPSALTSSMTYYDGLGSAQSLQFQFTPSTPAASGSPNTNTWTMNIFDAASATPTTPVGTATLVFNSTGANAGTLSAVTPVGGVGSYDATAGTFTVTTSGGQNIPINIGALNSPGGMTQFDGTYQTTKMSQNGAPFGVLQGVSIGSDGIVSASFSNGTTRPIYQVDLVKVPNPDGLTPVSGDAFNISLAAGVPQLVNPGQSGVGTLDAGSLEGSNVDITSQLTNMIQTQRAYSSNAMVVQTANQMLDTINHLNA